MAGANAEIRIDDREVLAALDRLSRRVLDMRPAFRDAGEALLNSHRARFRQQVSPEGKPWAPLSPAYKARKHRNQDKILVLRGYLQDTLRYQANATSLKLGTDRIYGATHQFGDPARHIPARPFLGLSSIDRAMLVRVLQDHAARSWDGT